MTPPLPLEITISGRWRCGCGQPCVLEGHPYLGSDLERAPAVRDLDRVLCDDPPRGGRSDWSLEQNSRTVRLSLELEQPVRVSVVVRINLEQHGWVLRDAVEYGSLMICDVSSRSAPRIAYWTDYAGNLEALERILLEQGGRP